MDRLRVIYHPAPIQRLAGQAVTPEPVALGEDPDFAMRWIRRRLGLRAHGPFPLTTRYGPDILPLRDPGAMTSLGPPNRRGNETIVAPPGLSETGPRAASADPGPKAPESGAEAPLAPAGPGDEPVPGLPSPADERDSSTSPAVPILADDDR